MNPTLRFLTRCLALFSYEVKGLEWETRGWRMVGNAQFRLDALAAAKVTWEHVRDLEPQDLEANLRLGTIYQKLGDLERSTAALNRALENKKIEQNQRAEAFSLLASNFKTLWRQDWEGKAPADRAAEALGSPHLQESFENYERAFDEDLNHYYSGLNALAMIKVMIALAEALPDVWGEQFETDRKAADALEDHSEHARQLVGAVQLSLKAITRRLEREDGKDSWVEISKADLANITTTDPPRVATAYRKVLQTAENFNVKSTLNQLGIYRNLEVLNSNLEKVFEVVGQPPPLVAPGAEPAKAPRQRILLFAGHRIDEAGRAAPRFPAGDETERVAREKIKEAVVREMQNGAGVACAYAGAASGGDILFQEVCAELKIPTRLYLAIPKEKYIAASVAPAGEKWKTRFWNIYNEHEARKEMPRVLSETTEVTSEADYLPAWLRSKAQYDIWSRNNLWMLFNALDEGCDPKSGDPNITLIALWDGGGGDGPGGTADLVKKVNDVGARCETINTREIFGL
jgi:tetratricopeptide (TPR) repeat protein